ncbi:MAG: hypothetical protein K0V04_46400, partial [Deltaproteobacteria bacterium]|nr:hypothetical protein [Deltaproteobacteria bacterium]
GEVRTASGETVTGTRWTFETPRPSLTPWDRDQPLAPRESIVMVPDQAISLSQVRTHTAVTMVGPDGEVESSPIPVRVRLATAQEQQEFHEQWDTNSDVVESDAMRPEVAIVDHDDSSTSRPEPRMFAIDPVDPWPTGVELVVRVDAELRGVRGPLPMSSPMVAHFATRDRLRVGEIECDGPGAARCEPGPVSIMLSTEVDLEQQPRRVTVSPRPDDLEIEPGWPDEGGSVRLYGDFEVGQRYRVRISPTLRDIHGQRLGKRVVRTFTTVDYASDDDDDTDDDGQPIPRITLSNDRGTFWRPEDAQIGVFADDVEALKIRVAVLSLEARVQAVAADDLSTLPWPDDGSRTSVSWASSSQHIRRQLDLTRFGGHGDALLVEVVDAAPRAGTPPASTRGLYQLSGLGAVTHLSPARGVARVTTMADAQPHANVDVVAHLPDGPMPLGKTDADGLLALPGARTLDHPAVLTVRSNADTIALRIRPYRWLREQRFAKITYQGRMSLPIADPPAEGLERGEMGVVALAAGRGVHMPGDTIHIAGWGSISTPYHDIAMRRAPTGTPVVLTVALREEVVATRRVTLDEHGRFSASIGLPAAAPMGRYRLEATMLGASGATSTIVAEPRIPAFELLAHTTPRAVVRGEPSTLSVKARHLSGEPTVIEQLRWTVTCRDAWFHPLQLDREWDVTTATSDDAPRPWTHESTPSRPVDHLGVVLPTTGFPAHTTQRCAVAAAATDPSLQQVGAETEFLVHAAPIYLGVRASDTLHDGEVLSVPVIAVDPRGIRVAQPEVTVEIWHEADRLGAPGARRRRVGHCEVDVPADGELPICEVSDVTAGHYTIHARGRVDGMPLAADTHAYVSAPAPPPEEPETRSRPHHTVEPVAPAPPSFEITPRDEAAFDQPLALTITGPWETASGVLLSEHAGLREFQPFTLADNATALTVTPRAGRGPTAQLHAIVARPPTPEGGLPRVLATRSRSIALPSAPALDVSLEVPARARPGREVMLRVHVHDDDGGPVDARNALWVID